MSQIGRSRAEVHVPWMATNGTNTRAISPTFVFVEIMSPKTPPSSANTNSSRITPIETNTRTPSTSCVARDMICPICEVSW